jgi:hypothetical protein
MRGDFQSESAVANEMMRMALCRHQETRWIVITGRVTVHLEKGGEASAQTLFAAELDLRTAAAQLSP